MQTLWCRLQPVWTLPLMRMCSKICICLLQGAPRPVWTGLQESLVGSATLWIFLSRHSHNGRTGNRAIHFLEFLCSNLDESKFVAGWIGLQTGPNFKQKSSRNTLAVTGEINNILPLGLSRLNYATLWIYILWDTEHIQSNAAHHRYAHWTYLWVLCIF